MGGKEEEKEKKEGGGGGVTIQFRPSRCLLWRKSCANFPVFPNEPMITEIAAQHILCADEKEGKGKGGEKEGGEGLHRRLLNQLSKI